MSDTQPQGEVGSESNTEPDDAGHTVPEDDD